jgi:threonine/homoserine/homoserine lactone efflux protein
MLQALLLGVLAGYGSAIPPDSLNIALVDTAMARGLRRCLPTALYASSADITYSMLAVLAGGLLASTQVATPYLEGFAVAALLAMAVWGIWKTLAARDGGAVRTLSNWQFLLLTLAAPWNIAYWAAVGFAVTSLGLSLTSELTFAVAAGLASISWQTALVVFGAGAHHHAPPRLRTILSLGGYIVVLVLALAAALALFA